MAQPTTISSVSCDGNEQKDLPSQVKLSLKLTDISNEENKSELIPLRIPYCKDPRRMTRSQLQSELRNRRMNANGHKSILVARLLQSMLKESNIPNPCLMDDRQPEKWALIANQNFEEACKIESNPKVREECMGRVNERLAELTKSREGLINVATGAETYEMHSSLYQRLIQFGAALMLEPIVEEEAITESNTSRDLIRSSVTIFNMCTGYQGIPEHLTESGVNEHLNVKFESRRKRKNVEVDGVQTELNAVISVDVNERQVKCRVIQASSYVDESNELNHLVVVEPVDIHEGGKHATYALSLEEYQEALSNPLNEDD